MVLFDGFCNLCSGTVRFAIARDRKKILRFAPLQSAAGQRLLKEHGRASGEIQSIVFIQNGKVYTRSGAALRFFGRLGGPWTLLPIFLVVPAFIRDAVYDRIARNRYRWYGKKEACWVPAPDLKSRFLE